MKSTGNTQRKMRSVREKRSGRFIEPCIRFFRLPSPFWTEPFRNFSPRTFLSFSLSSMTVYSRRAPNTKMMHAMTQHSMAVRPSACENKKKVNKGYREKDRISHLRTVGLYCVMNIDQYEEYRHKKCHPAGDNLGVYEETGSKRLNESFQ